MYSSRLLAVLSLVFGISTFAVGQGASSPAKSSSSPRVFLLDADSLVKAKGMDANSPVHKAVRRAADRAMNIGPFSVMDKQVTPPSGDKHDYMSQAPYFWPNPKTANGLPYIRKDGERNPEIRKITDHDGLSKMAHAVRALAVGYYVLGDESYAQRAALLLRTWFLDPKTRMNPNLEFGQGIPGRYTGRNFGIIETEELVYVVDAVGLLDGSKSWTADDEKGMREWFTSYAHWLRDSDHGRKESAAKNNHGTHYDVQLADYDLFIGDREAAKEILTTSEQKRIASQVEPDGEQPLELARTRALSYSTMNLRGLMYLAVLGDHVGLDLWNFSTKDGRSIRNALDYLLPYAIGQKKWDRSQITEFNPREFRPLLALASVHFDKSYLDSLKTVEDPHDGADSILLIGLGVR